MKNEFSRAEILLGSEALKTLSVARVAVFGVGGVGSFVVEALVRGGIHKICLFDSDTIDVTNINRQIMAYHSTLGMYKTEALKRRIYDINPRATTEIHTCFYDKGNSNLYDLSKYDYIVDAMDTVSSKIELIKNANSAGVKIISCMGTGNKLDPLKLGVADIYKTSVCPLAKVMRKELKKLGIPCLKTLFSTELPVKRDFDENIDIESSCTLKSKNIGSVSFVPSVAGIIIAGEVIKDIIGYE